MTLIINIVLTIAGNRYYTKTLKMVLPEILNEYPFISILVPAHNEAKVIQKTVESLLAFDYPADRYEIIVINDNSSDYSAKILEAIQKRYPSRMLTVINTDAIIGGKGKSNALNIGFQKSKGEFIAIYDADNTPEKAALKYLVFTLAGDESLGAVIGKFRTRNRNVNMLTRFINIETLTFQWMAQAGRWQLFKLCTIPGTNFVIRRSILEQIGGWDIKAIAEDTEISFRIYQMGYKIKYLPQAVTWEQEPQTLPVWIKQRTRWTKGNYYVLVKNCKLIFSRKSRSLRFDIFYYLSVYILFLSSIIISDLCFVFGLLGMLHLNLEGSSVILWILAYAIFVLSVTVTLITEKGESSPENIFLILIMYFTYCQLWMIVAVMGIYGYISDLIRKRETKWYKTERF
jgi:cellulose synthase/poly-beta-1,6-N-acetylglucosamine synthase-like glycosyltransferase